MLKYVLLWLPMVAIAIANGALRDLGYRGTLGELRAHQLSTLSALVLFGLYIRWVIRRWPPGSVQAVRIGLLWLAMTLAFEFLFGHYVAGHPWSRLLRDYDLAAGRVWVFIPLWVLAAPIVFQRLRYSQPVEQPQQEQQSPGGAGHQRGNH